MHLYYDLLMVISHVCQGFIVKQEDGMFTLAGMLGLFTLSLLIFNYLLINLINSITCGCRRLSVVEYMHTYSVI